MINDILQFLGLDHFNIKLSAKFYQNISNGLRIKFHFFQKNSNLGKISTNPNCHLTISMATSCQYQCVCKISSQCSTQFKRWCHFHFFRIWNGYILSILMSMQNFITMFHSVQEMVPFLLFQNLELGKTSTVEKWLFAISWARSCQYQCLCRSISKYSTQFKR